jgi:fatty-acid desaturase
VNSICHTYGGRRFATKDESHDNWPVALVSLGEGWHHSHHLYGPVPLETNGHDSVRSRTSNHDGH